MTLIRLLAARTATELNVADLAAELGIPLTTFRRYLPLFETTYIHHSVAAWSGNISAKVVKRPKVHFVDSGAAATLVGTNALALARPTSTISGQLLETFVAGELARQLTWRRTRGCITGETAMAQKSISSLSRPTADGRVVVSVTACRRICDPLCRARDARWARPLEHPRLRSVAVVNRATPTGPGSRECCKPG